MYPKAQSTLSHLKLADKDTSGTIGFQLALYDWPTRILVWTFRLVQVALDYIVVFVITHYKNS